MANRIKAFIEKQTCEQTISKDHQNSWKKQKREWITTPVEIFGDLMMLGQVQALLKSEKFPHSRQWKYRNKGSELSIYSCKFKLQYCATNVEES